MQSNPTHFSKNASTADFVFHEEVTFPGESRLILAEVRCRAVKISSYFCDEMFMTWQKSHED